MPVVLEPVSTGGFDDQTTTRVFEVLRSVLESDYDIERLKYEVDLKIREHFGSVAKDSYTLVAGHGQRKNLFFMIRGMKGGSEVPRCITNYHTLGSILIMAKFQSVRSLQYLAAYQVSCCVPNRNNLEELPIPPLIRKIVENCYESKE